MANRSRQDLPQVRVVRFDEMKTNDIREAIVAGFHILADREKRDVLEVVRECYNGLSQERLLIPGHGQDSGVAI